MGLKMSYGGVKGYLFLYLFDHLKLTHLASILLVITYNLCKKKYEEIQLH